MFKIFAAMAALILSLFFALPSYALEADALKTKIPGDHVLGKDNAKITLIEYASLSCAHCASFHANVLPTIQKEYIDTGKVRLIFRDFPLNAPALAGAQLAHCAGKQSDAKYFATVKQLFAEQKNWAFDEGFKAKLSGIAKGLGIDAKTFESCLADKQLETKILTSRMDGSNKLHVESTPTFFINGEKTEIHSPEEARKLFNTVLGGKTLRQDVEDRAQQAMLVQIEDMMLGQHTAPVTVIEYVNIACPHCGEFHKTLVSTLQKDYIDAGKVKLVFRELPLQPSAFYAYMIAHCSGKDTFFDTLSLLIDEGQSWSGTQAFITPLRAVAAKAGINEQAFYACIDNEDIAARIQSHASEAGEALGINHSPTLFINGKQAGELHTADEIRRAVNAALKGAK